MKPFDIATALGHVPSKRLAIIDLANRLAGKSGLDLRKAAAMAQEISDACREARSYSESTRKLLWNLQRLDRDR